MAYVSYQTRLYGDDNYKVIGGSFDGAINLETVNQFVNSRFSIVVKKNGKPVFVDSKGREVTFYLSVDPSTSEKGAKAIKDSRAELAKQAKEAENRRKLEQDEIDKLLSCLSHDDIVRCLHKATL